MKYLVTGGAGFIGSNIVDELLRRGNKVRVLDNFATGKRENLLPLLKKYNKPPKKTESAEKNYDAPAGAEPEELRIENGELRKAPAGGELELIEGDLRSFHIVRSAVKGVDYVLHQGALPSVPRSIDDPITTNDVNVLGTLNILEAAKEFGVKRVVYASSSSVYGNSEELPKREDMPIGPLSPYALTKYTGEAYCQIYYHIYGLETVCLRYFNVFGPRQDPTSQYSAVIPKFIKAISEGRAPIIYGDGLQSRDFTYVENNVWANIEACTAPGVAGEVMNIATNVRFTLLELVEKLNEIMGTDVKAVFEEEAKGDVKHSLASIEKAKKLLNYEVKVSFEEGLRKTVEFFTKK
jgi:UDP-glucose 4-epimerase